MECLGPQCAALLLDWLRRRAAELDAGGAQGIAHQATLFAATPYVEEAPAIRDASEMDGALEHLEFSVFRRLNNQLTRAERARLDNSIDNALFKADRFLARQPEDRRALWEARVAALRGLIAEGRDRNERQRDQARRAETKLAQLGSLSPEAFEEFVAEVFEALGHEVERVGGTGDEGADLRLRRGGLLAVVQCKYHSRGVIGSPELQKFLGTIHHTRSHKGYFVTTRTFTLAAERFAGEHPIELIDGPRLVELVRDALGPAARRPAEPSWF
jgi:restriction system protein